MVTGRRNQLTKQRGEYLVASELASRGLLVATFSGNVPDFDLVAVRPEGSTALVQVKASASTSWQLTLDKFVDVEDDKENELQIIRGLKPLSNPAIVWVMLQFGVGGTTSYWILRHDDVQRIVHRSYKEMLERYGGHRPRKWATHHTALWPGQLDGYRDRWELITEPA